MTARFDVKSSDILPRATGSQDTDQDGRSTTAPTGHTFDLVCKAAMSGASTARLFSPSPIPLTGLTPLQDEIHVDRAKWRIDIEPLRLRILRVVLLERADQ